MEYTKLGNTGLEVSRICLGCLSFGEPQRGEHPWSLGQDAATAIISRALDRGINLFDTANVYSDGSSEEIVGRVLRTSARRDDLVLATKVNGRMHQGANGAGLSRKAVMAEVDNSLRRLGMDYVDIYQIHRFDPSTPVEETLEVLNDIVKAGKARYVGASSMSGWQLAKMLRASDSHGWARFVTMQNHYNLLYREEEREMLPLCGSEGIGVIPWSPLARGRLTRHWDAVTGRSETDDFGKHLYTETDRSIVEAVATVAGRRSVTRAQVAVAWLLSKPVVSAPIVGVTGLEQLNDVLGALSVQLTPEEIAQLERPYEPHRIPTLS